MSTLKNYLIANYGVGVQKKTIQLKETKKDVAKTKNQFIFLQRCVKHRLIPKSLRIKSPIKGRRTKEIVEKYRMELLISLKNTAKHRFFGNATKVKALQDDLRLLLSQADMEKVEAASEKAREAMFIRSKQRLVKKFDILRGPTNNVPAPAATRHVKDPFLNLADDEVPDNHKELLSLGPKFVPNMKKIPVMDIITTTEASALKLEFEKKVCEAQILRKDVLRVLKTSKPIEDNLSRGQRQSLKEIINDPTISIYPFDKGTGLVRLKTEDAIQKIREQIGNTDIVDRDPTDTFARDIRIKLAPLNKKGRFTKKEYELIYPSDAVPPRMYGLVKAHKPEKNYPMRLVVSTIGSPPYGLASYLVGVIQPTLDKNPTRLKNSAAFIEKAKSWTISPTEVQVSYDVVNLYPTVPLKKATDAVLDLLSKDDDLKTRTKLTLSELKQLLELCLSKCYFIWNSEIHELKDSGPIGLSLMVVMAEGWLQVLEAKAMDDARISQPPLNLLSFLRYVDDSHTRFDEMDGAHQFLTILNSQDPSTQYTMDIESPNKEMTFLEVKTINSGQGKYEFDVHRKKAITNVQVKPESSHDPRVLKGIFKGFVHRALRICSEKFFKKEIEFLVDVFTENGYQRNALRKMADDIIDKNRPISNEPTTTEPNQQNDELTKRITLPWIPKVSPRLRRVYKKAGYDVAFKSGRNLASILSSKNKTALPKNSYPGVYKIPCTCGKTPYRGETKKKISTRLGEHETNVAKGECDKSGVALHSKNCTGRINFEEAETVAVIHNKFNRKVRETLEIQKHDCHVTDGGMNPDKGQYVTTTFWIPLLKHLKNTGI